MSARRKYLYRVTAVWPRGDGTLGQPVTVHFQTKRAADHRAALLREGRPAVTEPGREGEIVLATEVVRAASVVVERSHPVTWPEEVAA